MVTPAEMNDVANVAINLANEGSKQYTTNAGAIDEIAKTTKDVR